MLPDKRWSTILGAWVRWANLRRAGATYHYRGVTALNSLIVLTSGEARFEINRRPFVLRSGCAAFLSAGDCLAISAAGRRPLTFLVFNFRLFDTAGNSLTLSSLHFPPVAQIRRPAETIREFSELVKRFRKTDETAASELSLGLVRGLRGLRDRLDGMVGAAGGKEKAVPEALQRAAEFVYGNLGRKIGLQDLARAACINASYLSRLFRKTTGESPMEFVRRLKIERSKNALLASTLPIERTALRFGFESAAHFSRTFRKYAGLSPSRWVRKHRI